LEFAGDSKSGHKKPDVNILLLSPDLSHRPSRGHVSFTQVMLRSFYRGGRLDDFRKFRNGRSPPERVSNIDFIIV